MKRLTKVMLGIIILFSIAYAAILTVEWRNLRDTRLFVQNFTPIVDLNTYVQSSPKIYMGEKKISHAVLLLHGWSSSPQEYAELVTKLKAANIPYYVPQLLGFGLGDMHLLRNIETSDWLRDAIYAYDVLAANAQEVSIIGHSNGGVLAVYVAQKRPVKHLILAAPNLAVSQADKIYKTALNTPIVSQIMQFCLPVFSNPRVVANPKEDINFRYPTLPIKSLVALWALQDKVNIAQANFQDLTLLYGKHDQDVDIPQVITSFNQLKIPYNKNEYLASAHDLFEGADKTQVITDIIEVLKKTK